MTRNFKLIPQEKLADYSTPLREAQNRYNERVSQYNRYLVEKETAERNLAALVPTIDQWAEAMRELKYQGKLP